MAIRVARQETNMLLNVLCFTLGCAVASDPGWWKQWSLLRSSFLRLLRPISSAERIFIYFKLLQVLWSQRKDGKVGLLKGGERQAAKFFKTQVNQIAWNISLIIGGGFHEITTVINSFQATFDHLTEHYFLQRKAFEDFLAQKPLIWVFPLRWDLSTEICLPAGRREGEFQTSGWRWKSVQTSLM